MNSIRKQLSASDVATQIRLQRAVHSGSFLLVEGSDDSQLFKRFVDQSYCSIEICYGRENVFSVVSILEQDKFSGFLAIADADFAALTGEKTESQNIVLTDQNDIECMLIASNFWNKVLLEYGSEEKIASVENSAGKSAKELIVEQAAFVGAMRLTSKKSGWALKFKDMKYKFVSNTCIAIDQEQTIQHIVARSNLKSDPEADGIMKKVTSELNSVKDFSTICSGHDVCRILARALRHKLGSYNGFESAKGLKDLRRVLRLSYEWADFISSNLYECMVLWEKRNQPFRIFSA